MTDWNTATIEEFRSNGGKVGGHFEGATLLLLHHVGARTGTKRVTHMMYRAVGDSYAVFASKAGADSNPGLRWATSGKRYGQLIRLTIQRLPSTRR